MTGLPAVGDRQLVTRQEEQPPQSERLQALPARAYFGSLLIKKLLENDRPMIISDEIIIRPVLNELAKANRELIVDFSLSLIQAFCKYEWGTLEDAAVKEHSIGIDKVLLTGPNAAIVETFFHESGEGKKIVAVRSEADGVAMNSRASTFAWLYSLLGMDVICQCALCFLRQKWNPELSRCCFVQCPGESCSEEHRLYSLEWRLRSDHLFRNGVYHCDSHDCAHRCKRWADLERHISTRHCLKAPKYPCTFPGCERGGDNGFARKDKLKSHFENVHRGRGIPPKQPRILAPRE